MTTTELRKTDFELVVAPGADGKASGSLYLDDGVSVTQKTTTQVSFSYQNGKLTVSGKFGFATGVNVARVKFLGVAHAPHTAQVNGKHGLSSYDAASQVLTVAVGTPFKQGFTVSYS